MALENWSPPISHMLLKAMHGCAWWSFQSHNSQECCSAFVLKGGIHDWAKFCEAFDFEDPGFRGLELLGAMCSARWANGMLQTWLLWGLPKCRNSCRECCYRKSPFIVLYRCLLDSNCSKQRTWSGISWSKDIRRVYDISGRVSVPCIEIIIIFVDDLSISPREAWHPLLFERLADGREKHNFMQAGCQWT